ncbi:hypothetical protein [Bradyrhizobium sp.]|uniref:hypothetical protein n=1 Tax=Bradyrhizobium sp. TaxID=376 RepID=UPI0040382494
MASVLDVYRMLTWMLLRGPRDPRRSDSVLYNTSTELFKDFNGEPPPVVGVGWSMNEKAAGEILILIRKEGAQGIGQAAISRLNLSVTQEFTVREIIVDSIDLTGRSRPSQGGDSLGASRGGRSGTFGCLVRDAANTQLLLTCAHIVVPTSDLISGNSYSGDVWQPSSVDGGVASDDIGTVESYAPISFGGYIPNRIDAALVKPKTPSDVIAGLRLLGSIAGSGPVAKRRPVRKSGWKTKQTQGNFLYVTSFIQRFGNTEALFENQLGIVWDSDCNPFSADGDSGALVVNERSEAVGLVFAASSHCRMSFANPIHHVLDHFGVVPL